MKPVILDLILVVLIWFQKIMVSLDRVFQKNGEFPEPDFAFVFLFYFHISCGLDHQSAGGSTFVWSMRGFRDATGVPVLLNTFFNRTAVKENI